MIILVLFVIVCLSLAMFPFLNEVITAVPTSGWGTIVQGEHVILPFLFLFAVLIIWWGMRKGSSG